MAPYPSRRYGRASTGITRSVSGGGFQPDPWPSSQNPQSVGMSSRNGPMQSNPSRTGWVHKHTSGPSPRDESMVRRKKRQSAASRSSIEYAPGPVLNAGAGRPRGGHMNAPAWSSDNRCPAVTPHPMGMHPVRILSARRVWCAASCTGTAHRPHIGQPARRRFTRRGRRPTVMESRHLARAGALPVGARWRQRLKELSCLLPAHDGLIRVSRFRRRR